LTSRSLRLPKTFLNNEANMSHTDFRMCGVKLK
jgi:hypothetical protein